MFALIFPFETQLFSTVKPLAGKHEKMKIHAEITLVPLCEKSVKHHRWPPMLT